MTDEALIRLWQAGDQHAATTLVERHSQVLQRVAGTMGVREEVEELVQDVFVRAFAALHTFRGDKSVFRTWLITIMKRLILDRGRATQRADRLTPLDSIAESEPTSSFDALDQIIARETERRLFARIRPDDLPLVRMRIAGRSWRNIARTLSSKEATVKVRFHRIRSTLRAVA